MEFRWRTTGTRTPGSYDRFPGGIILLIIIGLAFLTSYLVTTKVMDIEWQLLKQQEMQDAIQYRNAGLYTLSFCDPQPQLMRRHTQRNE
jgi:hypothetical protein